MNEGLSEPAKIIDSTNNDSWMNIITGMGMKNFDKRLHTTIGTTEILGRQDLLNIYRGEGLGKKIITIPAGDMIREWISIEGDPSNLLIQHMDGLAVKQKFKEALTWSRLFGGAVILMGIDDGQELDKEVNEDQILSIDSLEVYDRWDINWTSTDLYDDLTKPNYGLPEWYELINQSTGTRFRVHSTRILRFDGELLPTIERQINQSWGDSVMQSVFGRLRGTCDGLAGSEMLLTDFIVGVLKIPNLQQLLGQKDGQAKIRNRMQALDIVKHIMNTIVMDKNEEFERISASGVSGLESLLSLSIDILCSVAGIPRVKLIGDQSKGLGSEAAGNVRLYYDDIAAMQEDQVLPQINRLVKLTQLSKTGPLEGIELESWSVVFNPLWQPTAKEDEETRQLVAKRDEIYAGMGLPAEVILVSRFGGDSYSREMVLPEQYRKQLEEIINSADLLMEEEPEETIPNEGNEEGDMEE